MAEIADLLKTKQKEPEVANNDSDEESLQTKRAKRYKNKQNMQASKQNTHQSTSSLNTQNNLEVVSQDSGILGRIFGRKRQNVTNIETEEMCETSSQFSQQSLNHSNASVINEDELTVTQKYWITKIELELLSSPLDQAKYNFFYISIFLL